uniref:tRNA(Ile)-lysidine synthetase n=1 Tax=Albugo laibachii Nc14 TaxID=890382 RepID=F0WKG8_9STRA|nr:tRNA(Ile)lysidine synthase putative [Albugo laibachii Nc14]|eukprot:CCA21772.1 tRNA(Ile)lysidine synthase putative [Albugo laibachii Nc14]
MIDCTRVDDVLSFWFDGDQNENYKTKWFPPHSSHIQNEVDEEITHKFSSLLAEAQTGQLAHWESRRASLLALIIVLDQFSRHIYRKRSDRDELVARNDKLSTKLVTHLIEKKWHLNMAIPQYVFAMMPIRHSPSAKGLKMLLKEVDSRKVLGHEEKELLDKFSRTTQQRLLHLQGTDSNTQTEVYDILERQLEEKDDGDVHETVLFKSIKRFLVNKNALSDTPVAVSLSGGVDSMVLAYLLHKVRLSSHYYGIVAIHIDYGNRPESAAECSYVKYWCDRLDIQFYARRIDEVTRGETKRDEYEKIARDIRYSTYRSILEKHSIPGICFGHHRGDVQENVVSNMMKGLSLLSLNGMSETSTANGVVIWRPMLEFDKSTIFDFAHRYGIPYFKDTTPAWSTRGKLRNQLMPLLRDMYGDGYLHNISNLGAESIQCNDLMQENIMTPIMSSVQSSSVAVWFSCSLLENQPFFIWKEILRQICHFKLGGHMIREKPIRELMTKVQEHKGKGSWITLKKQNRSFLTKECSLIIFRDRFFPTKSGEVHAKTGSPICLDQEYAFGPWLLQTKVIHSSQEEDRIEQMRGAPPISLWNLIRNEGFSYILPQNPQSQFVISSQDQTGCLKKLDKAVRNIIPLVSRAFHSDREDSLKSWLVCTFRYDNNRI